MKKQVKKAVKAAEVTTIEKKLADMTVKELEARLQELYDGNSGEIIQGLKESGFKGAHYKKALLRFIVTFNDAEETQPEVGADDAYEAPVISLIPESDVEEIAQDFIPEGEKRVTLFSKYYKAFDAWKEIAQAKDWPCLPLISRFPGKVDVNRDELQCILDSIDLILVNHDKADIKGGQTTLNALTYFEREFKKKMKELI